MEKVIQTMFSTLQKNAAAFCALLAMLTLPFTGNRAYAQGDGGILTDGYGHWDWGWLDWPPANGCPHTIINISTGVDNAGTPLSLTTPDPNWICPAGMGSVVYYSGWGTFSGSRWLGNTSFGTPPGTYSFTRNFTLPLGASGIITLQAIADNRVKIYLDGGSTPIALSTPWDSYGFLNSRVANYTAAIGPGSHSIVAQVVNEDGPSGLDLYGTVDYTNTNTSVDLSTGVVGFLPLPVGTTDPYWSCPAGYNKVTTPHPYWDNFTGSQWLGDGVNDVPAGSYDYYRTFNVPGASGILNFEAMGDNTVKFDLDGNYLAQTGATTFGYTLPYKVVYTGGVTGGTHTLHAVVTNNEAMMGLNLHGSIAYCNSEYDNTNCITDPYYTATFAGPNSAAFFSSANPMNTSTAYATVTHYWDFGDGGNSTAVNPVYTYATPASYLVTHTVTKVIAYPGGLRSRCSSTKSCWVTVDWDASGKHFSVDCGSGDPSGKPGATITPAQDGPFAIFPNPAQDELKISRPLNSCELSIFSVDGRSISHVSDFTGQKIDISNLPAGSYILKIAENNKVTNLKFNKIQ